MIETYVKKYMTKPSDFKEKINQIYFRMIAMKKICGFLTKKTKDIKEPLKKKLSHGANYLNSHNNNKDNGNNSSSSNTVKSLLLCKEKDIMIDGGNHKSEEEVKEFLKSK